MTISVGTPSTDTDNGVSSVTFSHTTVAGKGRQLLVGVSFNNDGLETITGVTFNGVALSLVVAHDRDDDSRCELWRLQDPPTGTFNVVVTLDGTLTATAGIVSGAVQLDEVDSVTPVGATASNDGDSALNTVTVNSNTGELVVDVAGVENETNLSADVSQTELWNLNAGTDPKLEGGGSSYKAGASPDVTMEWTQGTDKWVSIAASFRPSVAPTVDAGGPYMGIVSTPIALNATVTPGTDASPALTWTIDAGPGGGTFLPSANVEDPTFTPDSVGAYTLRLTAVTVDAPDVFDTASVDSMAAATPPTVDAGGPYNGPSGQATALNATVTPGTDPTPALLWTIDSGGAGTFLPSATIEDPTFTPTFPTVGPYTLRLTATPSDTPPVFDTAAFESDPVAPIVDAGGPYSGTVDTPIALDATVTPGTDPAPTLLWTIDSGPGTGVFSDPAIEDPTFTPDLTGTYTLRLTVTPSDGPAVFDTSDLDSQGFVPVAPQNLVGIKTDSIGRAIIAVLGIGAPLPAGAVILAGDALAFDGTLLVVIDDGIVPRTMVNGIPHTHDGVRIVTENPGDTVLNGFRLQSEPVAQCINDGPPPATPFYNKGFAIDGTACMFVVDGGPAPTPGPFFPLNTLAPLAHWVDFSDPSTLWNDTAGTIPITNGALIRRADSKGQRALSLLRASTAAPVWRDPILNGLGIADFAAGPATRTLSVTDPNAAGLLLSSTGLTMAAIVRRTGSAPAGQQALLSVAGNFRLDYNSPLEPASDDFHAVANPQSQTLIAAPALNTWYLIYQSIEVGGSVDDYSYASPGPEVNVPWADPGFDILTPYTLEITAFSGDYESAEVFFWEGPLTASERTELRNYADNKYGVLPHL